MIQKSCYDKKYKYIDMLAGPLGRCGVLMYHAILGVIWCCHIWGKIQSKMLLWECINNFCGEMNYVHFNMIMEHYIPCFILWL